MNKKGLSAFIIFMIIILILLLALFLKGGCESDLAITATTTLPVTECGQVTNQQDCAVERCNCPVAGTTPAWYEDDMIGDYCVCE